MRPLDFLLFQYWLTWFVPGSRVSGQVLVGNWTWLSGSNTINQPATYGTLGTASADNRPGARRHHSMVMHPSGQWIYVFGGQGYGYLNDMWMFNVTSGLWMWLSGDNTRNQPGIYGSQGLASVNNRPGARYQHTMVIDLAGKLYVFGGWGYTTTIYEGYLNDMWMYNITSGWWTWLSGSNSINQLGVYGVQGVSSANNRPGAREGHSMVIDPSGQFINVFGGSGHDESNWGRLNDMWMFDVTSRWWTWLSGANTRTQVGAYGTQGVASVNNRPGARYAHSMVMHPSGKLIFVFGGYGYDATGLGTLSDTWALNITSRRWTWLSGSNTVNQPILYGTQGLADQNNGPGARTFHSMVMHPSGEFMFVFSGFGDDTINYGPLNDLWMYNVTSGWWTWLSGSPTFYQRGVYGTQGLAEVNNQPGARRWHSMVIDPSGQSIFVFGGDGYDANSAGLLNDMWKFSWKPLTGLPESTIPSTNGIVVLTTVTATTISATKSIPVSKSVLSESSVTKSSISVTKTVVGPKSVLSESPASVTRSSISVTKSTSKSVFSEFPGSVQKSSVSITQVITASSGTVTKSTLPANSLSSSLSHTPNSGKPGPRSVIRVRNIWQDNLPIVLTVITAILVILFNIGFVAGYVYEERRGRRKQEHNDTSSSSPMNSSRLGSDTGQSSSSFRDYFSRSSSIPTNSSSTNPGSHGKTNSSNFSTTSSDLPSLVSPSEPYYAGSSRRQPSRIR